MTATITRFHIALQKVKTRSLAVPRLPAKTCANVLAEFRGAER